MGTAPLVHSAAAPRRATLGIAENSYSQRTRRGSGAHPRFRRGVDLFRHCRDIGAGGAQLRIDGWDRVIAGDVRAICEQHGGYIEGQVLLPRDAVDGPRFERELDYFQQAGGRVARTVLQARPRYEAFDTLPAYQAWCKQAIESLRLAEPYARKMRVKLAVENHKDLRVEDMLAILRSVGSDIVGVCVDTGNSIALLEDPLAAVEAYAPHAMTVHLKDIAVRASAKGFLLSDVALGDGFLDLAAMVKSLRAANPAVTFNLDVITRDPIEVPVRTARYRATMKDASSADLERTMDVVRRQARNRLVSVRGLEPAAVLALEDEIVRRSLSYAGAHLGLCDRSPGVRRFCCHPRTMP